MNAATTVTLRGAEVPRPRSTDGLGRGALLALGVHALLVLALAASVSWRSKTPQTFSAELWAAVPQAAAPRAMEPTPVAPPPPTPAPAPPPPPPTPAPAPAAPPPTPAPAPAPDIEAQIAIEKARLAEKEKAERERLAREKAEQEKAEREKAERAKAEQAERERVAREKAEREKLAQEKAEREKAEKEKADKLAREKAEREKAAKAKAEAEAKERARLEAQKREKAAEEQLAKQREENLKRMLGQAGATGTPGSTGSAMRDAAPSANYAGRLIARIKPNILLTDPVSGSPAADVEVRAAPSGTILGRRLVKSSGNKDWDEAVLRAIDRTAELPRDVDGRVPPVMVITFTP